MHKSRWKVSNIYKSKCFEWKRRDYLLRTLLLPILSEGLDGRCIVVDEVKVEYYRE